MSYVSDDSAIFIKFSVFLNPSIRDDLSGAKNLLEKFNLLFSNDEDNANRREIIQKRLKFSTESNSMSTFIPLKENFTGK